MKIVIFANGEMDSGNFFVKNAENSDLLICCDGGSNYAAALGLTPDVIVGDFDSINQDIIAKFVDDGVVFEKYPKHKDATDLELAVSTAISKNPDEIIILGAFGGRPDHFLGNIHALMPAAKAGIRAYLLSSTAKAALIYNYLEIDKENYDHISLIPITTEVKGIFTTGLEYALQNEAIEIGCTKGISNKFTTKTAKISLRKGILLAICTKSN